jgi:hypothetical protein
MSKAQPTLSITAFSIRRAKSWESKQPQCSSVKLQRWQVSSFRS